MQTDTPGQHFLPSEICRLVLGFLQEGGYSRTYQVFLKECVHLREYDSLLRKGQQYPTTIMGLSLLVMLEEYATLKLAQHATNLDTSPLPSTPRNAGNSMCRQTGQSMRTSQRQRTRALHRHKKGLPSRLCAQSFAERSRSGKTLGHASSGVSADIGAGLLETSSSDDCEELDVGEGEGMCTSTPTGTGSAASLSNTGHSHSEDTPVSAVSSSISSTSGFYSDTGAVQGSARLLEGAVQGSARLSEGVDWGSRGEVGRGSGVRLTGGRIVSPAERGRGELSGVATEGCGGGREFRAAGLTRTWLAHFTPVGSSASLSQGQQVMLQTGCSNDSGPAAFSVGEKEGSCDPSSSMEAASKRRKKPPQRRAESQGEVTATGAGKDPVTKMINSSRFVKTLVDNINTCLYDSHRHTQHHHQQQTVAATTTSVTDNDCTAPVSQPAASTAATVVSDNTSLEEEFDFLNKDVTQDAVSNIISMSSTDPIFKELFDIFNPDGEEFFTKHSTQNDCSEPQQGTASSGIREGLHTPPHCSAETDEAMTGFPAPLTMPSPSPSSGDTAPPSQSSRPHPAPLTFSTECIDLTSMPAFPSMGDFAEDQGSSVSADSQPVLPQTSGLGADNPDSNPGGAQDSARQAPKEAACTDSAESLKATAAWYCGAAESNACQPTDQSRHQRTSAAISVSEDNQRSVLTTAEQTSTVISQYSVFQDANLASSSSGARETEVSTTGNPPVTQTLETEVSKTGNPPVTQTLETEVSKTGNPPVTQTLETEVSKTGNLPVIQTHETEVSKTGNPPVTQTLETEVSKTGNPPVTQTLETEVSKTGNPPVIQTHETEAEEETSEQCSCSDTTAELSENGKQVHEKETTDLDKNPHKEKCVTCFMQETETVVQDALSERVQVKTAAVEMEEGYEEVHARRSQQQQSSQCVEMETGEICDDSQRQDQDTCSVCKNHSETQLVHPAFLPDETDSNTDSAMQQTQVLGVLSRSESRDSSGNQTAVMGGSEGIASITENALIHSEHNYWNTSAADNALVHSEHNYFQREIGEPAQGRPTYEWDEATSSASQSSFPEGQWVSDSEPVSPHRSRWGQLAKVAALDDSSTDPQVVFDGTQSGAFVIGANSSHKPTAPAVSVSEETGVVAAVAVDNSVTELTSLTLTGSGSQGVGVMENCPCLESEISDENRHSLAFHTEASNVTVLPLVLPTFHASAGTSTVLNPGAAMSDSSQLAVGKSTSLEMIPEPEHSQSESWGLPQSGGDTPRSVAAVPICGENSEGLVSTLVLSSLMKLSDFTEPQCFESDLAEVRTGFPEMPHTLRADSVPYAATLTCLPTQRSSMAKTSQAVNMSDMVSGKPGPDRRPCPPAAGEGQSALPTSCSSVTVPLSALTGLVAVSCCVASSVSCSAPVPAGSSLHCSQSCTSDVMAGHLSPENSSCRSQRPQREPLQQSDNSPQTTHSKSGFDELPAGERMLVSAKEASFVSSDKSVASTCVCPASFVSSDKLVASTCVCAVTGTPASVASSVTFSSPVKSSSALSAWQPDAEATVTSKSCVTLTSTHVHTSPLTSLSPTDQTLASGTRSQSGASPLHLRKSSEKLQLSHLRSLAASVESFSGHETSPHPGQCPSGHETSPHPGQCPSGHETSPHPGQCPSGHETSPHPGQCPTASGRETSPHPGQCPTASGRETSPHPGQCPTASGRETSPHAGQCPTASGRVTGEAGSGSVCRKVRTETQTATDGASQQETRPEVPVENVSAPAGGDVPSQSLVSVRSLEAPTHASTCSVPQEREHSSNQDGHRPKPKNCDATNTSCEEKTNIACVQDSNRTDSAHESGLGVKENTKCQGSNEISTGLRRGKKRDLTCGHASLSESLLLANSSLRKEGEVSENACDDQDSPVNVAVDIDNAQHTSSHTSETHLQNDKRTVKKCRLEGDTCIIKPPSYSSNSVNCIDHQAEKAKSQNGCEIQLQLGRPSTDVGERAEPGNPDRSHTRDITEQDRAAHHHASSDSPLSVTALQTPGPPLPPHSPPRPRASPGQSDVQFHSPPRLRASPGQSDVQFHSPPRPRASPGQGDVQFHTPPRPRASPGQSDVHFHTLPRAPVGTPQHGGTHIPRRSFPGTPSKYYPRTPPRGTPGKYYQHSPRSARGTPSKYYPRTPPRGTPSKYYPRAPPRGTPSKYYPRTPPRGTPGYSPLKSPYSPRTAATVSLFLSPRRKQLLSEPIPEEVFDEISLHSDSNLSDASSVSRPASACSNPDDPDRQRDRGSRDSSRQSQTLPRTRSQPVVAPALDSASRPGHPVASTTSSGQKVACPSEWPASRQEGPGQPSTPSPCTSSSCDLQHFRAVGTAEGPCVPHATPDTATLVRQSQGKLISVGEMLASTDDSSKLSATLFSTQVSIHPVGEGGGSGGCGDMEKSRMDREKELSPSDVFIMAGVSEEACRTNISMPILPPAVTRFLDSQIAAGELQVPMDFTSDLTLLKTPTTTPEKHSPRKSSPRRSPRRGSSNQLSSHIDQFAVSRRKSMSPKKRVRRRILANEPTEGPSKEAQLVRGSEAGLTTNPSPHLRHFASVSLHSSPQAEDAAVGHRDHAAATEGSVGTNHKPKRAASKAAAAASTEASRKVVSDETGRASPVSSSSESFSIHSCTSSEPESCSDDDIPLSELARKLGKQAAPVKGSTGSVKGSTGSVKGSSGSVKGSTCSVKGSTGSVKGSTGCVKTTPSETVPQARHGPDTADDGDCDTDVSYGSPDLSSARSVVHDGEVSVMGEGMMGEGSGSSQRSVRAATLSRTDTPLGWVLVSNKPVTSALDTSSRKLPLKKRPIGRKDLRLLWAETCAMGTAGLPSASSDPGGKTAGTSPGESARQSVQEEERGHSALSKAWHSSSSSVEVDICELSEEEGGSSTREQLPLLQSVRKRQAIIQAKKSSGQKKRKLAQSKSHRQASSKNAAPVNDSHSATPSSDGPSQRKSPSRRKRDRLRLKKKISLGTCDKVSGARDKVWTGGGGEDGMTRSGHCPERSASSERMSGSAATDAHLAPGSSQQAATPSGGSSETARGSPSDSSTPPSSIGQKATHPTSVGPKATHPTSVGPKATPVGSEEGQAGPGGVPSQRPSYISVQQPEVVGIQRYGPYRRIRPTLLSTTTTSYFPGLSREQSLTGQSPLDREAAASPAFSVFSSAPSPMTSELSAGLFCPSPLPPQSWPQSPFPQPSLSACTAAPCAPAAKTSVTSQSSVGRGGREVSSAGGKRLTSSSDTEQSAGKVTGETAVQKPARQGSHAKSVKDSVKQSSHTKSVKDSVKQSSHTKSVKDSVKQSSHTMLSFDTACAGKKLDLEKSAQKSSLNHSHQNVRDHCHSTTDAQKSGCKKRNSTQKAAVSSAGGDQHTSQGGKSRSKRAVCQKSSTEDEQSIVSSDQVHSNNKTKSDRKPASKMSPAHDKHSVDASRQIESSALDDTDFHEEKKPNSKRRARQGRRAHSTEGVAGKGRRKKSEHVQKASTETAAEEKPSGVNVGQGSVPAPGQSEKQLQSRVNVGQGSVSGPEQPAAEVEIGGEGGSLQEACDSFETEQAVRSIQDLSASGHDSEDLTSVSSYHQQVVVERRTESDNAEHAMMRADSVLMHGDNATVHETDLGPGSYGFGGSVLDRNEGILAGHAVHSTQKENDRTDKEILMDVGTTEGEALLARDGSGMADACTTVRGELLLSKQQGVNGAESAGSWADRQWPDLVSASSAQGSVTAPSAASSRKRKPTSPVGALCKKTRMNTTTEYEHSPISLGASFKQPSRRKQTSDREKCDRTGDVGTASHLLSMPFLGDVSRSPVKSLASKKSNGEPDSVVRREEEEGTPAHTTDCTQLAGTEGRVAMLDGESVLNQFSSLLSQVEGENRHSGTAPPPDQQGGRLPPHGGPLHVPPGEFQQVDSESVAQNPKQLANPSVTNRSPQQIQTAGDAGFVGSESVMDRFLDKFSSLLNQVEGEDPEAVGHADPDSAACRTPGHPQPGGEGGGQSVQPLEGGRQAMTQSLEGGRRSVMQSLYPASQKLGQLARELQDMRSARYSGRTQKRNDVRIRDGLVPKRRSTNRGSQNRRWRKNSQGSVRSAVLVSSPVLVSAGSSVLTLDITDSGGSPVKTPGSGQYRPILPKVTLQGKGCTSLHCPALLPKGGLLLAPPVVTPTGSVPTPTPTGCVPTPTPTGCVPTPTPTGSVSTPTATGSVCTPTPTDCVPTPTATGSVCTPNPTGSVPTPTGVSPVSTPANRGGQSGSCPVAASPSVTPPPGVPPQGVSSLNPLDAAVWSVLPELAVGMPAPQLQHITHTVQDDDHEHCMPSRETATVTNQPDCDREHDLLEGTSPQPLVIDDSAHSGTKSSQTKKGKKREPSAQNKKQTVRREKVSQQSVKNTKRDRKVPQQGRVVKQNHQKRKTLERKVSKQLLPEFNALEERLDQQQAQKSSCRADTVIQTESLCSTVLPLSPHTGTVSQSGTNMDPVERDAPVNSMSAGERDAPVNLVSASVIASGPSILELSELSSASQNHALKCSVDGTPEGTTVVESSVRGGNGCEGVTAVQECVPVSRSLSVSAASDLSAAGGGVPCGSSPPRGVDAVTGRAAQEGVSVPGTVQQTARLPSDDFRQPVLPVTWVSQPVSSVISSTRSATQGQAHCDGIHTTHSTSSHADSVSHPPHPSFTSPSHTVSLNHHPHSSFTSPSHTVSLNHHPHPSHTDSVNHHPHSSFTSPSHTDTVVWSASVKTGAHVAQGMAAGGAEFQSPQGADFQSPRREVAQVLASMDAIESERRGLGGGGGDRDRTCPPSAGSSPTKAGRLSSINLDKFLLKLVHH